MFKLYCYLVSKQSNREDKPTFMFFMVWLSFTSVSIYFRLGTEKWLIFRKLISEWKLISILIEIFVFLIIRSDFRSIAKRESRFLKLFLPTLKNCKHNSNIWSSIWLRDKRLINFNSLKGLYTAKKPRESLNQRHIYRNQWLFVLFRYDSINKVFLLQLRQWKENPL